MGCYIPEIPEFDFSVSEKQTILQNFQKERENGEIELYWEDNTLHVVLTGYLHVYFTEDTYLYKTYDNYVGMIQDTLDHKRKCKDEVKTKKWLSMVRVSSDIFLKEGMRGLV